MSHKKQFYIFFAFWIVLLMHNAFRFALWEQDEAAYSGFALNMISGKSWLIPEFLWSEQHRKTPFHFWLIATSYKIFGFSEWATRLPVILSGVGLLYLLKSFSKKLFPNIHPIVILGILSTNLLLSVFLSISFTDATLLFFNTAAIFFYILYFTEKKGIYLLLLNVAIGFSLITKGPPIVLIMGSMMGLHFLFGKDRWWVLKTVLFCIPSLIPLIIWILMCQQNGHQEFLNWLVDWYILKRTSGTVFGQTGPIGYYTALFLVSFIFWLPWGGLSFSIWKKKFLEKDTTTLLLLASLPGSWLLYEILPSKLPSYSLAALPILVLFLSESVGLEKPSFQKKYLLYLGVLALIFIVLFFIKFNLPIVKTEFTIKAVLFGMVVLIAITGILVAKKIITPFWSSGILSFGLLIMAWGWIVPTLESSRASITKGMSELTQKKYSDKKVMFTKGFELPGMAVYLQQKQINYSVWNTTDTFSNNNVYFLDNENIQKIDVSKLELKDSLNGWISDRGVFTTLYWAVPKKGD